MKHFGRREDSKYTQPAYAVSWQVKSPAELFPDKLPSWRMLKGFLYLDGNSHESHYVSLSGLSQHLLRTWSLWLHPSHRTAVASSTASGRKTARLCCENLSWYLKNVAQRVYPSLPCQPVLACFRPSSQQLRTSAYNCYSCSTHLIYYFSLAWILGNILLLQQRVAFSYCWDSETSWLCPPRNMLPNCCRTFDLWRAPSTIRMAPRHRILVDMEW